MSVSPDTLIRRVRQAAREEFSTPKVLGVDDWAFRKSKKYGTILVDLEKRVIIDLLPDREAQTLAGWLKEHNGIEFIARDRAGAYAEGASAGAPSAVQVAKRWHLLKNLKETVERFLSNHSQYLSQAAKIVLNQQINNATASMSLSPITMVSSRTEVEVQANRQKRYARYFEVMRLYKKDLTVLAISKALRMSRMTVYKYVQADSFPERAPTRSRGSSLDRFIPYLHQRLAQGCNNIAQLYREIVEQGYNGNGRMVRRYIARLRKRLYSLS
ncbi:MAG: transposase [Acidobacteriota bacterium]